MHARFGNLCFSITLWCCTRFSDILIAYVTISTKYWRQHNVLTLSNVSSPIAPCQVWTHPTRCWSCVDPLDQEKDIWHEDYVKSSLTSLASGEIQDKIPYPLLSPAQCCDSSFFFSFSLLTAYVIPQEYRGRRKKISRTTVLSLKNNLNKEF